MSSTWFFNSPTPGRTRESQVEKFFKAEGERADPIVREGIQNSLDAGNNNSVVRIRLTLGRWTPSVTAKKWPRYSDTLNPHLGAVADEIAQPSLDEDFRFLVFEDFEDFETSGLEGPPEQWLVDKHKKNAFFDFFRAEGVSHKAGGDRGRHGVGKFVFLGASRIRTIFGLTRRNDQRELLMGTTVLRHHTLRSKPYLPDGWFGLPEDNGNVLPLEDEGDAIARFKKDFQLTRDGECGLSIVVPWLVEDINAEKLIRSVVEGYFLPLICNQLVVEVVDEGGQGERIDYLTIRDVVAAQGDEYALSMQVRLDLAASFARSKTPLLLAMPPGGHTAPQWGEGCIPTEVLCTIRAKLSAGDWIHLECPTRVRRKNERVANPDQFQLYFQRPAGQT